MIDKYYMNKSKNNIIVHVDSIDSWNPMDGQYVTFSKLSNLGEHRIPEFLGCEIVPLRDFEKEYVEVVPHIQWFTVGKQ